MYQNFPGNFIPAVTGQDCCDFCASSCICDDSDWLLKQSWLLEQILNPMPLSISLPEM